MLCGEDKTLFKWILGNPHHHPQCGSAAGDCEYLHPSSWDVLSQHPVILENSSLAPNRVGEPEVRPQQPPKREASGKTQHVRTTMTEGRRGAAYAVTPAGSPQMPVLASVSRHQCPEKQSREMTLRK